MLLGQYVITLFYKKTYIKIRLKLDYIKLQLR